MHPQPRTYDTTDEGTTTEMLELAILGLLKEGSMHGYQLKKRLSETLGASGRCRTARSTRP